MRRTRGIAVLLTVWAFGLPGIATAGILARLAWHHGHEASHHGAPHHGDPHHHDVSGAVESVLHGHAHDSETPDHDHPVVVVKPAAPPIKADARTQPVIGVRIDPPARPSGVREGHPPATAAGSHSPPAAPVPLRI